MHIYRLCVLISCKATAARLEGGVDKVQCVCAPFHSLEMS